jgi:hypothetical protein
MYGYSLIFINILKANKKKSCQILEAMMQPRRGRTGVDEAAKEHKFWSTQVILN